MKIIVAPTIRDNMMELEDGEAKDKIGVIKEADIEGLPTMKWTVKQSKVFPRH